MTDNLMNTARVALGVPVGSDSVSWRFMSSVFEMEKTSMHGLIVRQGSLIDRNRNEIVRLMLEHPAQFTHLLFLDSDMIFPQHTLKQLLNHQKPVVGGLYFQRVPPFYPIVFDRIQKENQEIEYQFLKSASHLTELHQVGAMGTGCLLVERKVFESMKAPWFAIEWKGNEIRGEDLYFAEQCHKNKIPLLLDTNLNLKHMGVGAVEKGEGFVPKISWI